jgi:hypothetical protein
LKINSSPCRWENGACVAVEVNGSCQSYN